MTLVREESMLRYATYAIQERKLSSVRGYSGHVVTLMSATRSMQYLPLHFDSSVHVDCFAGSERAERRSQEHICSSTLDGLTWSVQWLHVNTEVLDGIGWLALGRWLEWCPDDTLQTSEVSMQFSGYVET